MDAFDKLAKLAGAAVESVGEGLPRTRKEALALGAARYFTGVACKRGHVAERHTPNTHCRECSLQIRAAPEYKEYQRKQSATPEATERRRRYNATPKRKEHHVKLRLSQSGDAVLFSINQAERAARLGKAAFDITPQCPEPQRSQLQALVDRIRADPKAGKAVVGLLRTMRELRKVELAELAAA